MRPAVHASFLRNRGTTHKRRKRTHIFSPRRLLFMVICGVVLFIPGLALTIVGLQNNETDYQGMDENHKIMYQAVGPAMGTLGIVVMFASCIYFNCYGTVPQTPAPLNSQQQSFSEQDPEEKGSIRNKQRDPSQQHQQLYSQKQHQLHNGRSVDVYTTDCENRMTIKEEEEVSETNIKSPHRTSEEDVPLAKMEDSETFSRGL